MSRSRKIPRPRRGSRTEGPTLRVRRTASGTLVTYAVFSGRFKSFGPADDPGSRTRFAQAKAEWEQNGRRVLDPAGEAESPFTIEDLADAFLEYAETYYRRADGSHTSEVRNFGEAFRCLLGRYRDLPAKDFGIPDLLAIRDAMTDAKRLPRPSKSCPKPLPDPDAPPRYTRKVVNGYVQRIRYAFRWAAERGKVPTPVAAALREVRHLQAGRSAAREPESRQPVAEGDMRATLPFLPRRIAALVEVMWLRGMRCGEAVQLRTRDVDMTGDVWIFRPGQHKNRWRGKPCEIDLGPRAQEVLRPWIKLDPDAYWLDPREEMADLYAQRSEARQTPPWPSHMERNRRKRKSKRECEPGPLYTTRTVAQAIHRACHKAKITLWSPHQLRHAALSRFRTVYGLEAAQAIGGHASLPMTEHYTRQSERALARRVAAEVG